MHINLNRSNDAITEIEALHLQQCAQCREDLNYLKQLHDSAKLMQEIVPKELNWQVIHQKTLAKKQVAMKPNNRSFISKQIIATAASTFFIAVGWLIWNNYQLQSQLEQVLFVNNQLEERLDKLGGTKFNVSNSFIKVLAIEKELSKATSIEIQMDLLRQREQLMRKIINMKESGEYEYSI